MTPRRKLTKTQARKMLKLYFEEGATVKELAKEFGIGERTVYTYLSDSELLNEQDARINRRLLLAKGKLASIQPEALDTMIELMREEKYKESAPYITQNASRDLMDRGGLKLEEERDDGVTFDFSGTGIELGMPEKEAEPEDVEEIKRQLAETQKRARKLERQVEAERKKREKETEKQKAAKKPAAKKPTTAKRTATKGAAKNGGG